MKIAIPLDEDKKSVCQVLARTPFFLFWEDGTGTVAENTRSVLVVEPTAFGFHNFQMVYELVSRLQDVSRLIRKRSVRSMPAAP